MGRNRGAPSEGENSEFGPTIFVHGLLGRYLPAGTMALGTIVTTKAPIVVWRGQNKRLGRRADEQSAGICGQRYGNIDER
jgi:hypothetical protein